MNTEIIYSDRKTLSIQVCRDGKILVRAPFGTSAKYISQVLESKKEWIATSLEKLSQRAKARPEKSEAEIKELIKKAKAQLPPIIEKYSRIMGVTPTRFTVTRAKTRFGACSGKNAISFSCLLMDYPQDAIEYVVVHELAHIKEHNHSKLFWAEVAKILPDWKEREALLK